MANNPNNLRLPPAPDLSVQPLSQIDATSPQLPSPTLVSDAVSPKLLSGKGRKRQLRVADETTGSMGIHGQQKRNKQMMRVPERLERLLSDLGVRRGVHQQHAQQHDMTGDAPNLRIVNLHRADRS